MNLPVGVSVKFENGVASLSYDLKVAVKPYLDQVKADLISGKIDPIKGTSLDATAGVALIDYLESKLG